MKPEPWSTISEVAAHLHVAEDTVLRWIPRKAFPAHRAGRVWRFKISEVDEWMRNGSGAHCMIVPGSKSNVDARITAKPSKNKS